MHASTNPEGVTVSSSYSSAAAWGAPYGDSPLWKWGYDLDLIRNLRDVEHDMRLENIEDTGTYKD